MGLNYAVIINIICLNKHKNPDTFQMLSQRTSKKEFQRTVESEAQSPEITAEDDLFVHRHVCNIPQTTERF